MNEMELLYAMALTRIPTIGTHWALVLYKAAGSAVALYEAHREIKSILPEASPKMQEILLDYPKYVEMVKPELDFMERFRIKGLVYGNNAYPCRLMECVDAPLVLFQQGDADLNARHIISMIGTRRCTEYGRDMCRSFLRDLSKVDPSILVVSGLAYGIDANAHEQALANGLPTVGVLAHGLDRIYPQANRRLAEQMLAHKGGLLTEYFTKTEPDAFNFVQRNRIVAGMSDCCIVVESDEKGGSLITADLAMGYNRDVFAFPGRCTDRFSKGCNKLIERNSAALLTDVHSFLEQMRWGTKVPTVIEKELFIELSPDEERVVAALKQADELQINVLAVQCNLPIAKLSALLLGLEMKGMVKALVGGSYRLLS